MPDPIGRRVWNPDTRYRARSAFTTIAKARADRRSNKHCNRRAVAFSKVKLDALPGFNSLLFLAGLYLAIAVHELGHLIVGKAVGFDPGALMIGGFTIAKSGKHWVFRFQSRRILGKFVRPLPKLGKDRRKNFGWMIAAGPITSFLLAIARYVSWMHFGNGRLNWIGSLFWGAATLAALTFVPSSKGLNRSDISRIWQLLFNPAGAQSWIAMLMLQKAETNGTRPRDWDQGVFEAALVNNGSESESSYRRLMAYYRSVDQGDEAVARNHLESALANSARLGAALRTSVFLEAAAASAFLDRNVAQAHTWLERARKTGKFEHPNAIYAAIAMCEERYEDAIREFGKAIARIEEQRLDSGLARSAKAKFSAYTDQCRASASSNAVSAASENSV